MHVPFFPANAYPIHYTRTGSSITYIARLRRRVRELVPSTKLTCRSHPSTIRCCGAVVQYISVCCTRNSHTHVLSSTSLLSTSGISSTLAWIAVLNDTMAASRKVASLYTSKSSDRRMTSSTRGRIPFRTSRLMKGAFLVRG